ncbi:MAG: helix-turn-helix transcriptional regulator [Clostridium sp.]|nr:helix-turn-helix transcriptional regulator [Clostridium sp.]
MDNKTLRKLIGEKVKTLRKSKGHSQEYLAEQLQCSKERISRLERGSSPLTEDFLLELSNFYNEDVSYFYTFNATFDKQNLINEINTVIKNYTVSRLKQLLGILKILK